MGLLEGQVALVTGGARGQGRAHAIACAQQGADVVLVDVSGKAADVDYGLATAEDMAETVRLVEELGRRALAFDCDVRSQEQLDEAVEGALAELGRIDILIANAGIWSRGKFWDLTEESWNEMISINLSGVWRAAKAVAPHMIERGSGSIVIISSVNGIEPGPFYAHYIAAKHGVIGLMKAVALELAPHGIRCNAICPGAIDTPMTNNQPGWNIFAGHDHGTEADMIAGGYHYGALRGTTFLKPEVIANAAVYLNSPQAAPITGVVLPVDAGHLLLTGFNLEPVKS
ncbi:mycofactocin-coupled SDR family oxidoreductase [Frankia sp. CNm7]|uniref:Mycofactocin-coupled SDR family oxidoreductase n=1 Tax=Frankia nepalensis TaxID=1836974 RepID=A0A937R812_9ACTN|nr:mycofactocin-coupled SDR family oxidoreductase [Frankia nepalensis]MBL7510704.1 mycofactocin-coupled SDR family oxidoreductase [Frankia nepalensis]MBL7516663.1 mycofactocin-coupled SDR family oxidoreductase [Frankia nepalensis]MBL7627393.1 mycofactocin-coupled SDR family oxidoreductase [Frankia nepalensis]